MKIKPSGQKVAIEFIDPNDDNDDSSDNFGAQPSPDDEPEAVLVLIAGVGPEVKGIKTGNMAFAHPWVRNHGLKVNDKVRIVDSYDIAAVVTT